MAASRELDADYRRGGFAARVGFGRRPALLVVDFIKAYTTPDSPFYAAPGVPAAVAATRPVLERARAGGIPVVYTRVCYGPDGRDGGWFVRKIPTLRRLTPDSPLAEIVDALRPRPDEPVLDKKYASAFFGTPLAAHLTTLGVDTLILTGCSTSGCVRASAVDGMQHGFRVIVPRECVGDRAPGPHESSLFDIDAKYGDVVGVDEVLAYLDRLGRAAPD